MAKLRGRERCFSSVHLMSGRTQAIAARNTYCLSPDYCSEIGQQYQNQNVYAIRRLITGTLISNYEKNKTNYGNPTGNSALNQVNVHICQSIFANDSIRSHRLLVMKYM